MATANNAYDDSSVKVLSAFDAIKKRPGMYIGDTEFVAYTLGREAYENASDEAGIGFANVIKVILSEKNTRMTVRDNGRGIPIGMNEESNMSTLKAIFMIPHSGGKFEDSAYGGTSGGLHGIGITATCCFSKVLDAITKRDGKIRHLHVEEGIPCRWDDSLGWVKDADYDPEAVPNLEDPEAHGTEVSFVIDHTIPSLEGYGKYFPVAQHRERLRQLAFLNLGCEFQFTYDVENGTETEVYRFNSWKEYFESEVLKVDSDEEILTPDYISIEKHFPDDTSVQAMLCFSTGYAKRYKAFTNSILNIHGGRHVIGMDAGIYEAFSGYGFTDDEGNSLVFDEVDLCRGISGILSIRIKDAKYNSQTKERLSTKTAESFVQGVVVEKLREWIGANTNIAKNMCELASLRYKSRRNSERTRSLANAVQLNDASGTAKPMIVENYNECNSLKACERELFIVEGDSASGLIKKRRNRDTQAVMCLKGKVLNSARKDESAMLNSKELNTLMNVIGAGISDICDPSRSRFHKVIITTDADSDGAHIRSLLQSFFGIYMYPMIEAGYIYVVAPPLYGATNYNKYKGYTAFGNSKLELIKEIEELPDTSSLQDLSEIEISERLKGWNITRYKGLGEMSEAQTHYTILDSSTRLLRRLTASDFEQSQTDVYNMMGSNSWYRKQALGGIPLMTSFEDSQMSRPMAYTESETTFDDSDVETESED